MILIYFSLFIFIILIPLHLSLGHYLFSSLNNLTPELLLFHPPLLAIQLNHINSTSIHLSLQLNSTFNLLQLLHHQSQNTLINSFIHRSPNSLIQLNQPIYLYSNNSSSDNHPFVQINFLNPFLLPLSYQSTPSQDSSHLNLVIRILSPQLLNTFIHQTIQTRSCRLRFSVKNIAIQLNADRFPPWLSTTIQSLSRLNLRSFQSNLELKLPQLPPIFDRLSDLITIDDYAFYPIFNSSKALNQIQDDDNPSSIGIRASASIPNPVLELWKYSKLVDTSVSIKWRIPLLIYRKKHQDSSAEQTINQTGDQVQTLMATALTIPFNLSSHEPRLSIPIEGSLVPELTRLPYSGPLSDFLNEFLKGNSNNLTIRFDHRRHISEYLAPFEKGQDGIKPQVEQEGKIIHPVHSQLILAEEHPSHLVLSKTHVKLSHEEGGIIKFISEFLKENLNLNIKFPSLLSTSTAINKDHNKINLIKKIQIKEMKINILSIFNKKIKCSGKLEGILNLPNQLKPLFHFINITQILPDVILLDGKLPNEYLNQTELTIDNLNYNQEEDPEEDYPSNAFGRLDLNQFIRAKLIIVHNDDENNDQDGIELRSEFDNVDLEILKGRFNVFSKYASKYLLHHKSNFDLLQSLTHQQFSLLVDQQHFQNDDVEVTLDQDQQGVETSILGTFSALGSIIHRFPFRLLDIQIFGSFFV